MFIIISILQSPTACPASRSRLHTAKVQELLKYCKRQKHAFEKRDGLAFISLSDSGSNLGHKSFYLGTRTVLGSDRVDFERLKHKVVSDDRSSSDDALALSRKSLICVVPNAPEHLDPQNGELH